MSYKRITLSHGSGGRLMAQLIQEVFLKVFKNRILKKLDDAAVLKLSNRNIAFTTDSYTIKPIFFPGGDIGKLAICGTVNDLAVQGAKPKVISVSIIIEEGFLLKDLEKIVTSMAKTAKKCGVEIVTGDTKVVSRHEVDGIFINTSGIGTMIEGFDTSCRNVRPGDSVIVSGSIAEHGMCILNKRENLGLRPDILSDVASIYPLVHQCRKLAKFIHAMRDPTRGGLAGVLNEISQASKVRILIHENKIPVKKEITKACDILGLDCLNIANEGKVILFVASKKAKRILSCLRKHKIGKNAVVVGQVEKGRSVYINTAFGTQRLLTLSDGEVLPRIC